MTRRRLSPATRLLVGITAATGAAAGVLGAAGLVKVAFPLVTLAFAGVCTVLSHHLRSETRR